MDLDLSERCKQETLKRLSLEITKESNYDNIQDCIFNGTLPEIEYMLFHHVHGYRDYPLRYVIEKGNIEHIKHFFKDGDSINKLSYNDIDDLCVAIHGNNFDTVKWYVEQKNKWFGTAFTAAIMTGNIKIMEYLYEMKCPWDSNTFSVAAKKGDLEIIKWLLQKLCPWDKWTFSSAAENGNLENMKLLLEKGCPWSDDNNDNVFATAICFGNLENMQWLFISGCPLYYHTFEMAATYGNLPLMKWLKDIKFPFTLKTLTCAKENGNLEIIAWLNKNDVYLRSTIDDENPVNKFYINGLLF